MTRTLKHQFIKAGQIQKVKSTDIYRHKILISSQERNYRTQAH